MATGLWLAAFIIVIAVAVVLSGRGRAAPAGLVPRGVPIGLALALAALAAAAPWVWGGAAASEGRAERLRAGVVVRLTLDTIAVDVDHPITIGWSASAGIRLPGDDTDTGDLIQVARAGDPAAKVGGPFTVVPSAAATAIVIGRGDPGRIADRWVVAGRCPTTVGPASTPLAQDEVAVAISCRDGAPRTAVAVHRGARTTITPLHWRGGRFVPTSLDVRAGDVLQVGAVGVALPGVTAWEMPAAAGASALLAIPADPTACASWRGALGGATDRVRAVGSGACAFGDDTFGLTARPIAPDAQAVLDRGVRVAIVIAGPPILLLLAFAAAVGSRRRAGALAALSRVAVVAGGLTALLTWRLLWAHRIDVLRDLDPDGSRVGANLVAAALVGASVAGVAISRMIEGSGARIAAALATWAVWAGAAILILRVPIAIDRTSAAHLAGQIGLSLIGAIGLAVIERQSAGARLRGWLARLGPGHALLAIAFLAAVTRVVAPRLVLGKLGLAYAVVIAGHAALRTALAGGEHAARRRVFNTVALTAAVGAVAALDVGVAVVIVGIGLALAMIVAGHDAVYDATQASRLGVLEREHARLVALHGVAAIAGAIAATVWALVASDQALLERSTGAVLHAPLAAALVFAAAAAVARSHRRPWTPWLAAALAALALWGARDVVIDRAIAGDGVGAHRVAVVVDPGYALLRDDHRFVASVAAWREAALPPDVDAWTGQGYFGARLADPGVVVSVENDYLPVLVARERGVGGLVQTTLLLLAFVVGAGATAAARLGHASRAHRARWLVAAVVGSLCVYQPLAALGVLPLTGISWPGLGIDSPADLWLVVLGAIWLFLGDDRTGRAAVDERIRSAPRLRRARRIAVAALAITGIAGVALVARAGASALGRGITAARRGAASGDVRVDRALSYAATLACPWRDQRGAHAEDVVPLAIAGSPTDTSTARFDRELGVTWAADRASLVARLEAGSCAGRAGGWRLSADPDATCRATLDAGWPEIHLAVTHPADGWHAVCAVELPDAAVPQLDLHRPPHAPRIRLVSAALGAAAGDLGELVGAGSVIRLRPGAPIATTPPQAASGLSITSSIELAPGVTIEIRATQHDVVVRGPAELLLAAAATGDAPTMWRRTPADPARGDRVLDRLALVVAGDAGHRRAWLFRPPRAFTDTAAATVDPLLADDVRRAGERTRRSYTYGPALPELGWTSPFDVDHSLGLDGWVHAALAQGRSGAPAAPAACGTLAPPPIAFDQVCSPSPLDGVIECRVALQPELELALRAITDHVVADPVATLGHPGAPTRAGFVVLRGDTGELLAQGDVVPGRGASAYAPVDAAAETALIRLREDRDPITGGPGERGETDGERVDWNLPIAVGSTLKPLIARAAEQAFPTEIPELLLTAIGRDDTTCRRSHRGKAVHPLVGHCPPTALTGDPTTADLHDFLERSPNWYMAALGIIGLGLPDGHFAVGDATLTLSDIVTSDLAAWPTEHPLAISDDAGTILGDRGVVIAGLRRTPLWSRFEAVLGRPLCTLGDQASCLRAAERQDVCAARGLPIATPTRDLRQLVALGPDRIDFYGDDRPGQRAVSTREYFQLLRGSGVHSIGSLAQLTDAFGRVIYDPTDHGAMRLAASWFPAPKAGVVPTYTCAGASGHANTVRGRDGGLCAVVHAGGTAHAALAALLADPRVVVYGAKTGTIDSLADIARRPAACAAWNTRHTLAGQPADLAHQPGWLDCGATTPDDSLFVIAFGVITSHGLVPITLGIQLQRSGKGAAARATRLYVDAIARYLQ